ncbi:MAG TPA: hypothetical protein PKD53_25670 [Chloroflexaceae bacterium]|nr:hypothetical protein [Chloroflexaceae bacterium]
MSPARKKPVPPDVLKADHATINALKDIPTYAPHDPAYSTEALIARQVRLAASELRYGRTVLAEDEAQRQLIEDGWDLHDSAVVARLTVKAQFGPDSPEVHAVGLTRKSDRKRPSRRAKAPVA